MSDIQISYIYFMFNILFLSIFINSYNFRIYHVFLDIKKINSKVFILIIDFYSLIIYLLISFK